MNHKADLEKIKVMQHDTEERIREWRRLKKENLPRER